MVVFLLNTPALSVNIIYYEGLILLEANELAVVVPGAIFGLFVIGLAGAVLSSL